MGILDGRDKRCTAHTKGNGDDETQAATVATHPYFSFYFTQGVAGGLLYLLTFFLFLGHGV